MEAADNRHLYATKPSQRLKNAASNVSQLTISGTSPGARQRGQCDMIYPPVGTEQNFV